MQEHVLQVRRTGERCGIVYDDGEKRVSGATQTKTLGAEVRSAPSCARPLGKRRADICDMTFFLMECEPPAIKHIEMGGGGGGVWVHIAQYKRQLMSCFKRLWPIVQGDVEPELIPELLAEDFFKALSLLPLARIRFDL